MNIINVQSTMSSKEISELTGKKHNKVLRDIRVLLDQLYGPNLDRINQGVTIYYDTQGDYKSIDLDKDHTMTLITGYEPKLRFTINKRWRDRSPRPWG